jgi:predicted phosphodiesterase
MIAILSDIHANLEALDAVLDDMGQFDVEGIYCLGDTVGYGPNPAECLDIMMHFQVALLGNHEEAARGELEGFTREAAVMAQWTGRRIMEVHEEGDDPRARRMFLKNLPSIHVQGDLLYVHASPRDPTREYVYPHDLEDPGKMFEIFRLVKRCCFMGHTHVPGIFTDAFKFYRPADLPGGAWRLDRHKTLCNVGSVGQPRDDDWRACYVLLDRETILFRRVEFDLQTTLKKIKQVPQLRSTLTYYKTS